MLTPARTYKSNFDEVQKDVVTACNRSGRDASSVTIIGVTKTVSSDAIQPLLESGVRNFGENRWQQAKDKVELPIARQAVWHFIGHLQSNKVKYIVPYFEWIHSIDTLELARTVQRQAALHGRIVKCLVQVNVSGEDTKSGTTPEGAFHLVREMSCLPNVQIRGLMTMAPHCTNQEDVRFVFSSLRDLRDDIQNTSSIHLPDLSMGMSGDYTVAVEEGATMIRVGRKLMEL